MSETLPTPEELNEIADVLMRLGEQAKHVAKLIQAKTLRDKGIDIDESLESIRVGVRAKRAFAKLNLTTIGDLISKTPREIVMVKGAGITTLNEIRTMLRERGLLLTGDW